jgi:hypothetical protein
VECLEQADYDSDITKVLIEDENKSVNQYKNVDEDE